MNNRIIAANRRPIGIFYCRSSQNTSGIIWAYNQKIIDVGRQFSGTMGLSVHPGRHRKHIRAFALGRFKGEVMSPANVMVSLSHRNANGKINYMTISSSIPISTFFCWYSTLHNVDTYLYSLKTHGLIIVTHGLGLGQNQLALPTGTLLL